MKKKIWIDTDLSVGMKRHAREGFCDVDDGFAVLQLLHADNIDVVAISAVFGNTLIDDAFRLCQYVNSNFSNNEIPVYKGSREALDIRNVETNVAVEALAQALTKEKMTIMAIGPATNVGLLLLNYPELSTQINEVVLVAGRRKPTDYFKIGNQGNHARDLNFDLDNDAFRIMFEHKINIALCPFEISNKVWLKKDDIDLLKTRSEDFQWLAQHSEPWLKQWIDQGAQGFNPFDVLASHYIIAPEDIISEKLNARLEIHKDDTVKENPNQVYKQYLICDNQEGYPVTYCYNVVSNYHEKLMNSLK